MSPVLKGVIAGVLYGALSSATMLPLEFPDKPAALAGAFLNRFGIGLVIGCVRLPWPGWLVGLFFGVLLSLPDAVITRAYAPILGLGAAGGTIIGGLTHGWRAKVIALP
jgi:hypothetical protein